MRKSIAHYVALGGVLAAVAMVIMCFVGLIPVATFISPMICIMICAIVYRNCGNRIAWAWYGAVSLMSIFFAPDKESALIFLFLGFYPILKTKFDVGKKMISFLLKISYFNCVIVLIYLLLLRIMGLSELLSEYQKAGFIMGTASVFLGNIAFFMLDFVLSRILYSKR